MPSRAFTFRLTLALAVFAVGVGALGKIVVGDWLKAAIPATCRLINNNGDVIQDPGSVIIFDANPTYRLEGSNCGLQARGRATDSYVALVLGLTPIPLFNNFGVNYRTVSGNKLISIVPNSNSPMGGYLWLKTRRNNIEYQFRYIPPPIRCDLGNTCPPDRLCSVATAPISLNNVSGGAGSCLAKNCDAANEGGPRSCVAFFGAGSACVNDTCTPSTIIPCGAGYSCPANRLCSVETAPVSGSNPLGGAGSCLATNCAAADEEGLASCAAYFGAGSACVNNTCTPSTVTHCGPGNPCPANRLCSVAGAPFSGNNPLGGAGACLVTSCEAGDQAGPRSCAAYFGGGSACVNGNCTPSTVIPCGPGNSCPEGRLCSVATAPVSGSNPLGGAGACLFTNCAQGDEGTLRSCLKFFGAGSACVNGNCTPTTFIPCGPGNSCPANRLCSVANAPISPNNPTGGPGSCLMTNCTPGTTNCESYFGAGSTCQGANCTAPPGGGGAGLCIITVHSGPNWSGPNADRTNYQNGNVITLNGDIAVTASPMCGQTIRTLGPGAQEIRPNSQFGLNGVRVSGGGMGLFSPPGSVLLLGPSGIIDPNDQLRIQFSGGTAPPATVTFRPPQPPCRLRVGGPAGPVVDRSGPIAVSRPVLVLDVGDDCAENLFFVGDPQPIITGAGNVQRPVQAMDGANPDPARRFVLVRDGRTLTITPPAADGNAGESRTFTLRAVRPGGEDLYSFSASIDAAPCVVQGLGRNPVINFIPVGQTRSVTITGNCPYIGIGDPGGSPAPLPTPVGQIVVRGSFTLMRRATGFRIDAVANPNRRSQIFIGDDDSTALQYDVSTDPADSPDDCTLTVDGAPNAMADGATEEFNAGALTVHLTGPCDDMLFYLNDDAALEIPNGGSQTHNRMQVDVSADGNTMTVLPVDPMGRSPDGSSVVLDVHDPNNGTDEHYTFRYGPVGGAPPGGGPGVGGGPCVLHSGGQELNENSVVRVPQGIEGGGVTIDLQGNCGNSFLGDDNYENDVSLESQLADGSPMGWDQGSIFAAGKDGNQLTLMSSLAATDTDWDWLYVRNLSNANENDYEGYVFVKIQVGAAGDPDVPAAACEIVNDANVLSEDDDNGIQAGGTARSITVRGPCTNAIWLWQHDVNGVDFSDYLGMPDVDPAEVTIGSFTVRRPAEQPDDLAANHYRLEILATAFSEDETASIKIGAAWYPLLSVAANDEGIEGFCCENRGNPCEDYYAPVDDEGNPVINDDDSVFTAEMYCLSDIGGPPGAWTPMRTNGVTVGEVRDQCSERCRETRLCCTPGGGAPVDGEPTGTLRPLTDGACEEPSITLTREQSVPAQSERIRANNCQDIRQTYYCDPDIPNPPNTGIMGICRMPTAARPNFTGANEYDVESADPRDCGNRCGFYFCVYNPQPNNPFNTTCTNKTLELPATGTTSCWLQSNDQGQLPNGAFFQFITGNETLLLPPYCPRLTFEQMVQIFQGLNQFQLAPQPMQQQGPGIQIVAPRANRAPGGRANQQQQRVTPLGQNVQTMNNAMAYLANQVWGRLVPLPSTQLTNGGFLTFDGCFTACSAFAWNQPFGIMPPRVVPPGGFPGGMGTPNFGMPPYWPGMTPFNPGGLPPGFPGDGTVPPRPGTGPNTGSVRPVGPNTSNNLGSIRAVPRNAPGNLGTVPAGSLPANTPVVRPGNPPSSVIRAGTLPPQTPVIPVNTGRPTSAPGGGPSGSQPGGSRPGGSSGSQPRVSSGSPPPPPPPPRTSSGGPPPRTSSSTPPPPRTSSGGPPPRTSSGGPPPRTSSSTPPPPRTSSGGPPPSSGSSVRPSSGSSKSGSSVQPPSSTRTSSSRSGSSSSFEGCPADLECTVLESNRCEYRLVTCPKDKTLVCSDTCGFQGCKGQCCKCVGGSSSSSTSSKSVSSVPPPSSGSSVRTSSSVPPPSSSSRTSSSRASSSVPFSQCPNSLFCTVGVENNQCIFFTLRCEEAGAQLRCSGSCGQGACGGQCCECVPASSSRSSSSRVSSGAPPPSSQRPSSSSRESSSTPFQDCRTGFQCTVRRSGNQCNRIEIDCPAESSLVCNGTCGASGCGGQCCFCQGSSSSRSVSSFSSIRSSSIPLPSSSVPRGSSLPPPSSAKPGSSVPKVSSSITPFCIQFPKLCASSSPRFGSSIPPLSSVPRGSSLPPPSSGARPSSAPSGSSIPPPFSSPRVSSSRVSSQAPVCIQFPELCLPCSSNAECRSRNCQNGICAGSANGEACVESKECESGLCRGERCVACNVHGDCGDNRRCYERRCILQPVMGNGIVEPGEACDDGNTADGDGCSSDGRLENGQACGGDRECESLRCLDGVCAPCGLDAECGLFAPCVDGKCTDHCGNGTVDAGEECDDNGKNSGFAPNACRPDCTNPRCGDSIADENEQCDDGNGVSGDGCDRLCRIEVSALGAVTIDLPWSELNAGAVGEIAGSHPPAGKTGPGAIAVMAAGAAGGWAWMRRRRRTK